MQRNSMAAQRISRDPIRRRERGREKRRRRWRETRIWAGAESAFEI
jgi:hypothetical protein